MHKITVINPFGGSRHRQSIWERMAREHDFQIQFYAPSIWRDEYGNVESCNTTSNYLEITPVPVIMRGNIPLHFFKQLDIIKNASSSAQLTYMYHEPHFLSTIQLSKFLDTDVKFGFHSAQNISRQYPFPFNFGEKFVLRRAQFATTVSHESADILRARGFSGPVGLHRFGLEDKWFAECEEVQGLPTFAFIGRFVEEKGIQLILDVFIEIQTKCKLLFVGEGPLKNTIKSSLNMLSHHDVIFMGKKNSNEIISILDKVDFTLVPSITTRKWKEQFGRVVIESGARGAIPIVSNSGELPQLAKELSFTQVFEENSILDFKKKIESKLQNLDLFRAERSNVQSKTKDLFSESKIASEISEFLKQII